MISLCIRTTENNGILLSDLQRSIDFLRTNKPLKYEQILEISIPACESILNRSDDITIILANYKSMLNATLIIYDDTLDD